MAETKEKSIIKIPKFRKRTDYRLWKEGLTTYLRSKGLAYQISYVVLRPFLASTTITPFETEKETDLPSEIIRKLGVAPIKLRTQLADELEKEQEIKAYSETLDLDAPDDLFELSCDATIFVAGVNLYILYDSKDEYNKGVKKYLRDKQQTHFTISSTMTLDRRYLLNAEVDCYSSMQRIKTHFHRDFDLEQDAIFDRFEQLTFKNMSPFIEDFEKLLTEYESVGGDRNDKQLHKLCLRTLPNRYNDRKSTYEDKFWRYRGIFRYPYVSSTDKFYLLALSFVLRCLMKAKQ